jgi:hypothetical protein
MLAQTPVQIAWVTRDLATTETALTALLGAKKWVRIPEVHFTPDTCTYRGEPSDFVANVSFSYAGDTQLELIEPVTPNNVYSEFLDACGPGLHHICVEVADPDAFDAAVAHAEQSGTPIAAQGVMPGGMRFAYASAPESGVPYIEIAYVPDEVRSFYDYVKQEQQ